jgi:SAM-dependent methyltransferase
MEPTSLSLRLDNIPYAFRVGISVHDRDFDAVYPFPVRAVSRTFWTPVRVAQRAAELLVRDEGSLVLDVGSGPGKFCIIGALTTRARFTGLEHRPHLVSVARAAAERLGAARTTSFVQGNLGEIEWERFDAFYFFNPFAENVLRRHDRLDDSVELSEERFRRDVREVYWGLERARPGTRVVTYHGFGRELPPSYRSHGREGAGSDVLELWVRSDGAIRARSLPRQSAAQPAVSKEHEWPEIQEPTKHGIRETRSASLDTDEPIPNCPW